jgi:hypothetical protein
LHARYWYSTIDERRSSRMNDVITMPRHGRTFVLGEQM